jgi:hypothetical protein
MDLDIGGQIQPEFAQDSARIDGGARSIRR